MTKIPPLTMTVAWFLSQPEITFFECSQNTNQKERSICIIVGLITYAGVWGRWQYRQCIITCVKKQRLETGVNKNSDTSCQVENMQRRVKEFHWAMLLEMTGKP